MTGPNHLLNGQEYTMPGNRYRDLLAEAQQENAGGVPVSEHAPAPEVCRPHGEFVIEAPKFAEQVHDQSRTNLIEYVSGVQSALGTLTEHSETKTLTEHESLIALQEFLTKIAHLEGDDNRDLALKAASMLENLTFIGKKEYDEAAKGIAAMWSERLRSNPDAQVCAVVGRISPDKIKSDAYLLDNVLKNFSDEDLEEFSGRLLLDPADLTADPTDATIVMLDDWTISGRQLAAASQQVIEQYPQYKDRVGVQLIAATEERIAQGLDIDEHEWSPTGDHTIIPVNAYFSAHAAAHEDARHSGAHITGTHCAVDFDFNELVFMMARQTGDVMPPATNIIRPYRKPGVELAEVARLRGLKALPKDNKPLASPPPPSEPVAAPDWF